MGNIVLLDDLTINKIAAGEVIERPASVVKEMVENSIDAGATKITVEIKNGGISFIRISDNGKGIAEDDMEIAFERHATSKIRKAEDILEVMSMGFRGEALASIAAIANVEMVSRTVDSSIGHKIVVEGGKTLEQSEVGAPIGTTITVKNLFYNTPVRYKFLKKDYTESGYIEDAITRLALVNKHISFKLISSGKTIIQTNGNDDEKSVIYSIYGKDTAEAIIETDYDYEGIKVSGVVGKPEIARSNRSNQLYFVNGRYIKDRTLTAAAEQAFKGMIPINKYGFLILNIQLDPALVDVNVHPAKLEVRFEEENKVFKAVYYTIKEALTKKELVENVVQKSDEKPEKVEGKKTEENLEVLDAKNNNTTTTTTIEEESKAVIETIKDDKEFSKKNKHLKNEEDESKENLLEEVYKFRKGLKEIGVSETSSVYTPIPIDDPEELKENNKIEKEEIENKEELTVPSESQVEQMTEELIKQRDAIENSKLENPLAKSEEENKSVTFDDMYTKVFGNKAIQAVNLKEFSDSEKKVLDEIKGSVKNDEVDSIQDKVEEKKIEENVITEENSEQIEEFKNMTGKNYKFIGIAFSTYIIVEIENEMYIIDQHAAHERIMYEKVKKNYYSTDDKDSQLMLLPDVITLSHKEKELITENVEMFEKAGFSLEAFGENTIKLNGVPNICIDMNTKQLFLELLDEIDNYSRTDRQEKEERFIATIACKSAVKAKMKLTEAEVDKLMERLLELPNPFTCPHGRPTAIKMSKYDIERKFARK
ncbi:MAG: DNA mismatch repair endonuclease MutL [Clostridia bacterium]|jgi:DNA mismatch repair protein MutL|nr:DNA mismatch repair endonuclease MutL [Clostridia bacterium]